MARMETASFIEGSLTPIRNSLLRPNQGILRVPRRERMNIAWIRLNYVGYATPNEKTVGQLVSDNGK